MKVLMIWDYYPQYLEWFYRDRDISELSFDAHRQMLFDDHFGWPAELCALMRRQGWDCSFLVSNDERLQRKWAAEHGYTVRSDEDWQDEIALEQVRRLKPDVLWVSLHLHRYGAFVAEAAKYAGRTIAWVGSPFKRKIDLAGISVLLTENPNTLRAEHGRFERVIVTAPGFDPAIRQFTAGALKTTDVVTVGQIARSHTRRTETIAWLLRKGIDLNVVGVIDDPPPLSWWRNLRLAAWFALRRGRLSDSAECLRKAFVPSRYERAVECIRPVCFPAVFGRGMYVKLAESRVVLNVHIDVAGARSGNMRMFEATGVGSCLVTEHARNIEDLFIPGEEVLTYRSKEELLDILKMAVNDPAMTRRIAEAGQRRTLRDHTLEAMFERIKPALVS